MSALAWRHGAIAALLLAAGTPRLAAAQATTCRPEDDPSRAADCEFVSSAAQWHADNQAPPYPPVLQAIGAGGVFAAYVQVDSAGQVQQVQVRAAAGRSDGASRILAQMVQDAATHWRFTPARGVAGPTGAWVRVLVVFTPRACAPEEPPMPARVVSLSSGPVLDVAGCYQKPDVRWLHNQRG